MDPLSSLIVHHHARGWWLLNRYTFSNIGSIHQITLFQYVASRPPLSIQTANSQGADKIRIRAPRSASEIVLTPIVKLEGPGLGPTAAPRPHAQARALPCAYVGWLVSVKHERAKRNEPRIGHYPNVELLRPRERVTFHCLGPGRTHKQEGGEE